MIKEQLPILVLAIPLLTSFVITIFSRNSKSLAYYLIVASMGASFACALGLVQQILTTNSEIHYHLGKWLPPFGIELVIDHLNVMVLALVSGAAFLTAIRLNRIFILD